MIFQRNGAVTAGRQRGLASVEMVLVVPILLMLMYIMVFSAKTMLLYGQRTIEARNGAYAIELYNGGNATVLDEFKQGVDENIQTVEAELAEVEDALGSIGLSLSDYIPDEALDFLQQVPVQRYGYIPEDSKNFYNTMLRTTRDEMDDYSTTDDPEIVKEEKIKNLSSILDNEYSKSGYTVGVGVSAFVGALGKFHPFTGHFTMRNTHFADFATQLELHDYNLNNQEAIDNGYDLKLGYSVEMEAMLDPDLIFTTIFADPEPDPLETPPPFELPFPVPVDPTVGIVPGDCNVPPPNTGSSTLAGGALANRPENQRIADAYAVYTQCGGTDAFNYWWTNEAPYNGQFTHDQLRAIAESNEWIDLNRNTLWPPENGNLNGTTPRDLQAGENIDRYGDESGSYVSPAGTPFTDRALPASTNRNELRGYTVLIPIPVDEGIAAPWFGEMGGGKQFRINWQELANRAGVTESAITGYADGRIAWLVDNDYLSRQ